MGRGSKVKAQAKGKATATAPGELGKAQRAKLEQRWLAKVTQAKNGSCIRWRGAQSKTRNGERGVIRVGDQQLSAVRVGIALAKGLSLSSVAVRKGKWAHTGSAGRSECVNPEHYTKAAVKAQARSTRAAR